MTTETKSDEGASAVVLLAFVPLLLWKAYAATKLWAWFVVPHFGAKPLPVAIAIGVALLVDLWFKPMTASDKPTTWESVAKGLLYALCVPAVSLLIGAVARGWVIL